MLLRKNHFLLKLITWLNLCLLSINPALALQYMPAQHVTNLQVQHHDSRHLDLIRLDSTPRALHINAAQQQQFIKQLTEGGYTVIPASHAEAAAFLDSRQYPPADVTQLAVSDKPKAQQSDQEECKTSNKQDGKPCEDKATTEKTPTTTISHARGFDIPNLGGGDSGDFAAVMFIVIGIVVIAALFVYAGKYIVDAINKEGDYFYWWDIGTHYITLATDNGEHGNFTGIKLGGGFVAHTSAHFGLSLEVGQLDLDLVYKNNAIPQRLTTEGNYWFVGPTVRWLLGNLDTEKTINNSHFYFELLGGSSDQSQIEMMGIARVGFNTGINKHLRLGLHYGAFYLGLNEDEGIANDGDNLWNMFGLEIGYQF